MFCTQPAKKSIIWFVSLYVPQYETIKNISVGIAVSLRLHIPSRRFTYKWHNRAKSIDVLI